jgi:hypothetical protein
MFWGSYGFGNGSYYFKFYFRKSFCFFAFVKQLICCVYFCTLQIIDAGIILTIVFIRYNYYDLTLTTDLYAISAEYNINMGYMKDALMIAVICILICTLIARSLYFVGIHVKRKSLFIMVCFISFISLKTLPFPVKGSTY